MKLFLNFAYHMISARGMFSCIQKHVPARDCRVSSVLKNRDAASELGFLCAKICENIHLHAHITIQQPVIACGCVHLYSSYTQHIRTVDSNPKQ